MTILVWPLKALIFITMLFLADELFVCKIFEYFWKKNKCFFQDNCLRIVSDDNTTYKEGNKRQTVSLAQCIFENMLQIFSFKLFMASEQCPDNDPGRPQLPEIPLFLWGLISLSVGSCNYRIGLPKRSTLSCSLCSVLRGLSPDQWIQCLRPGNDWVEPADGVFMDDNAGVYFI